MSRARVRRLRNTSQSPKFGAYMTFFSCLYAGSFLAENPVFVYYPIMPYLRACLYYIVGLGLHKSGRLGPHTLECNHTISLII